MPWMAPSPINSVSNVFWRAVFSGDGLGFFILLLFIFVFGLHRPNCVIVFFDLHLTLPLFFGALFSLLGASVE